MPERVEIDNLISQRLFIIWIHFEDFLKVLEKESLFQILMMMMMMMHTLGVFERERGQSTVIVTEK